MIHDIIKNNDLVKQWTVCHNFEHNMFYHKGHVVGELLGIVREIRQEVRDGQKWTQIIKMSFENDRIISYVQNRKRSTVICSEIKKKLVKSLLQATINKIQ